MTLRFHLDMLGRPVNLNAERAATRFKRASTTKQWRETAFFLLSHRREHWPAPPVVVTAWPTYATRRSWPDTGACVPSLKAVVDGAVDAGMLADDDPTHVAEIRYLAPRRGPRDGLTVVFRTQRHATAQTDHETTNETGE